MNIESENPMKPPPPSISTIVPNPEVCPPIQACMNRNEENPTGNNSIETILTDPLSKIKEEEKNSENLKDNKVDVDIKPIVDDNNVRLQFCSGSVNIICNCFSPR